MPLFDDPVRATINDKPVLWLGTESTSDGVYAVVVGEEGHVSTVVVDTIRAGFRFAGGEWIDAAEKAAADAADAAAVDPLPTGPDKSLPPGVIFDSDGNPYTADGDPL